MNYARETTALADEAMATFKEHGAEVSSYNSTPICIDVATYRMAEDIGRLRVYTIRDITALVGYAVYFVGEHPHFGTLQAVQDGMYIKPEFRGHYLSVSFLKWVNKQLQDEGVLHVFQSVPKDNDFGVIMARLGFRAHETVYHKSLEVQH